MQLRRAAKALRQAKTKAHSFRFWLLKPARGPRVEE